MAVQEVLDYISQAQAAGLSKQEITTQLLGVGWTEADIESGFSLSLSKPEYASGSSAVTQGSTLNPSRLDMLSKWIIGLIVFRLGLLVAQAYFIQFVASQDTTFPQLATQTNIVSTGTLYPLLWVVPLIMILRRDRTGYVFANILAGVLIYLNFFGLLNIVGSPLFWGASALYVVTGVAIIVLGYQALKLFPKIQGAPKQERILDASKVNSFAITLSVIFAVVVAAPGLLGFSNPFDDAETFVPTILAFLLGGALGWMCALSLVRSFQQNNMAKSGMYGVLYGALCGAAAQLPLYGFSGVQIIAMPIGGMIGIVVGVVSARILYAIMGRLVLKNAAQ